MSLFLNGLLTACLASVFSLTLAQVSPPVQANERVIRKNLAQRLPQLPAIDEVSKTPIPGIFEIRVGKSDIYYTDSSGSYLIDGQIIDVNNGKNITEDRLTKLTSVAFKDLPIKDAIVLKRGNGARSLAVFEDPNCGYCKRFEADLQKLNNVTIYIFLYPILGADSVEKSNAIWCANNQEKAWLDWMLLDVSPTSNARCTADAVKRNVTWGQKQKITGTPTIFLSDGKRIPGAITSAQLEKMLNDIKL